MFAHNLQNGCLILAAACGLASAQSGQISRDAYKWINANLSDIQGKYFLFQVFDSGLNHGIPSGLFASSKELLDKIPDAIDPSCVYDANGPDGCAASIESVAPSGTWLRLKIPPLVQKADFFGLNLEEPDKYGINHVGQGLDLRGATAVSLNAISITSGCQVKFAVRGSETPYHALPRTPQAEPIVLNFAELNPPVRRLSGAHVLFSVSTDGAHCPGGGSVLLSNVALTPVPAAQGAALGFPLANDTLGIRPLNGTCVSLSGRRVPPDQVNRNLAPIYESSLLLMDLLNSGNKEGLANARLLADAFVYALNHPNRGVALPSRPGVEPDVDSVQPAAMLNNAYMAGEIASLDDLANGVTKGEARPAGFTLNNGGESNFCLVLDGATGGNNAFAMLALLRASWKFETDSNPDSPYLVAARRIAKWIERNLRDDGGPFPGYYLGWNDGMPRSIDGKPLVSSFLKGKSVENNADIYAAMKALADRERATGDKYNLSSKWNQAALHAGNFVVNLMYDKAEGRFYSGTVPCSQPPGYAGIEFTCPTTATGEVIETAEAINTADFLDATTFVALALAGSEDYGGIIDWAIPVRHSLATQAVKITSYGKEFEGFKLFVPKEKPSSPEDVGIAWEFTGQMVVTMKLVDSLYPARFPAEIEKYTAHIRSAQVTDHFTSGTGIVASTIDHGEERTVYNQCYQTPFQCIASRPGLAATLWGVFSESGFNPLARPPR